MKRTREENKRLEMEVNRLREAGWERVAISDHLSIDVKTVTRMSHKPFPHSAGSGRPKFHHVMTEFSCVKEQAERLMEKVPDDTRDFTARLMGDPLPGRSALDRRASQ